MDISVFPFTHIFNLYLITNEIPTVGKSAAVAPLLKDSNACLLNNFICLFCMLYAVERVSDAFLFCFLTSSLGVTSSDATAEMKAVNEMIVSLDKKLSCAALFIDLSKA